MPGQTPDGEADRAQLLTDNAELRARLQEAEETLRAIRSGEVDALVVEGESGTQIFTLQGTEAESNRFRGDILAQISDAVVAVDNDQYVTYLNEAAARQYGIAASDALGRHLRELWIVHWPGPDDEAAAMAALRDKGRWRGESVHIKRSGERIHVESAVIRLHDNGGTLATIRDITDRKRIEDALRATESRYRDLFELSPVAVYSCNTAGVIEEFNRHAAQLWGREPAPGDTVRFCGSLRMFRPDGSLMSHEQCPMNDVLSGRREEVRDERVLMDRPDGSRIAVMVNIRAIRNERGEITGAINCFYDITERNKGEEARARLAAIVESSEDAIIGMSLDAIITSWNRGAERLFGYHAEEIVGQTVTVLVPKERLAEETVILTHIREGRPLEHFETVRRRRDGTFLDLSLSVSPIVDETGRVIGASKIARDITARKKATEALRESAERLRLAQEVARMGSFELNLETGHNEWTKELEALYGLAEGTFQQTQAAWERLVHPDDLAEALNCVNHALETGEPTECEWRIVWPDGSERWVAGRFQAFRDERGKPVRLAGVNIDITERRRNEEALRESEARKQAILNSALDAIITMDHEGRLLEFNPAAERIFGHARAAVLGRPLAEIIIPERLRESHNCGVQHYLATGAGPMLNQQIEMPALRADGTEFPAEFAIVPIPDAQPPVFTAFLRDVTVRRQLEESLVSRAEELARAARAKDEFLAMLAHELRNPLAPLRNAAELLKIPGVSGEEHAEAHRILGRSIENMSRLIDDLLDVSRITEGKIQLRREPVSLAAVLTAAAAQVRCSCAAHRQDLTLTLPPEPVFLMADATRLEQVFGNLLGNACKYAGDGCHITLSAERGEGEVLVRVADDGAGIDPEVLPRIFDLFVQASRTLDRAHGGLGIGLTLVQRLVKLHGGSITAHSDGLGHGAEFIVRLPILAEAPPPPPPPPPVVGETPRRILVVDDNTDSARSLAALQKRRGHETRTAFTGPEAVAVAADFLPEVVLLDIGLPGMDGFAVARQLRAMPVLQGVFIIAMSGYGHGHDRAEAKTAGFDEYMVKPLDLTQLRDWLARR